MDQPQKKIGCATWVVLGVALMVVIGALQKCGESSSEVESLVDILHEAYGPNNPVAKRIFGLNRDNAFAAGFDDGVKDARSWLEMESRLDASTRTKLSKLGGVGGAKRLAFDGIKMFNRFDAVVFDRYKRGWYAGANAVTME